MKASGLKLGLLGGGQLARMLALQCFPLGMTPYVLSLNANDPAAQVTPHWIQGDPNHSADLEGFLRKVDLATFESEFLSADLLLQIAAKTQTPVFPSPEVMGQLQDRLTQKQMLEKWKVPTAPFCSVATFPEAQAALQHFGGKMVLKQRRLGYDGYGTFMIRTSRGLEEVRERIESNPHGFIAEPLIAFRRELAVMGARSRSGKLTFFPLVESHQVNSRCLWVKGPLRDRRWPTFEKRLGTFLRQAQYVGIMGFEMFDTDKGLLINELAPRVHNTGHYSLEGLQEDQFTVHLKALFDLPFQTPTLCASGFAMMNLLGEGVDACDWKLNPTLHLHWYGKERSQPGRKMGHYTVLAKTPDIALKLAKQARKGFRV